MRIYWADKDDAEILTAESADDAIRDIIDNLYPTPIEKIGEITVYEYAPKKLKLDPERLLEDLMEQLDDEYGDWDNESRVTDAMEQAAEDFAGVIKNEYKVWQCDQTGNKVTVNALEWTKEHEPSWLDVKARVWSVRSKEAAR